MSEFKILPDSPAGLAMGFAENDSNWSFDNTDDDGQRLVSLDYVAELCGFLGRKYFVKSSGGFVIPNEWSADTESVNYLDFSSIVFEGEFATHAKVHIGRLIGANAVRALCLAFNNATIVLPQFQKVSDGKLLYVPVLAVNSMDSMSTLS